MKLDYRFVDNRILPAVVAQQDAAHFSNSKLGVAEYSNSVIIPGGGLYSENSRVPFSSLRSEDGEFRQQVIEEYEIEHVDDEVVFLGEFYSPWGHCITDNLSRVWPVIKKAKEFENIRICYIVGEGDVPKNFKEILELVGIDGSRLVRINRATRFRKVHLPDRSFWCEGEGSVIRRYTQEYVDTVNFIRDRARPKGEVCKNRRVYLTRNGWKVGCVDFGEQTVEDAFVRYYCCEVVRPEKLLFPELVRLMYECEILVTTDGSIAHSTIFGPDRLSIVILRKSDFVNRHQPVINEIRDLNVIYIDIYQGRMFLDKTAPWDGPFYLYVTKLLGKFLGCKVSFSTWSFLLCVKCWLHKRMAGIVAKSKQIIKVSL